MAGCAQRDSVPAKIELEDSNGTRIPPEQVDISLLGNLPNAERGALFALSQWCNGKLSSFLQLDLSQTNELVKILDGIPCFYAANQPEEAIGWSDGNLVGVSEYLPQKTGNRPLPVRQEKTQKDKENKKIPVDEPNYVGPPIEVEGSTDYLRIILPSAEHPGYREVLSLLREWNFLRDRSHRHWWWLRDSAKVLDFLASHQEDLELDFDAQFTDNFRKHTKEITKARLSVKASEST